MKKRKVVYKGEGSVTLSELKKLAAEYKIILKMDEYKSYSDATVTRGSFSKWEWRLFYKRLESQTGFVLSKGEWYNSFNKNGWSEEWHAGSTTKRIPLEK